MISRSILVEEHVCVLHRLIYGSFKLDTNFRSIFHLMNHFTNPVHKLRVSCVIVIWVVRFHSVILAQLFKSVLLWPNLWGKNEKYDNIFLIVYTVRDVWQLRCLVTVLSGSFTIRLYADQNINMLTKLNSIKLCQAPKKQVLSFWSGHSYRTTTQRFDTYD